MSKKTYGQIIEDHKKQDHGFDDDVIEYRRKMEPKIMQDVRDTAQKAYRDVAYMRKSFYVVLLMKVERLGQAPRTFAVARHSCPTPVYKQAVWKYHPDGKEEFLWSIPDTVLYHHIVGNAQQYLNDKETADLAKFVILMESGELERWVIKENGEKQDAVIKLNQEVH